MNKQELQGAFSKIHASDDLSRKVLSVEKDQNKVGFAWRPAVRVATAAALMVAILIGAIVFWPVEDSQEPGIIAVPGVMKVYACELDDADAETLQKKELTNDWNYYQMITNPLLSGRFCMPMTFKIPEDYFGDHEVEFEILSDYEDLFQNVWVKNGESILLDSWSLSDVMRLIYSEVGDGGEFYLDIVIRADGNVVGYGVVSFCFCGPVSYAYEFSTVCYPMQDGQFQDVSMEYVLEQMEAYKQTKKPGEGAAYISQTQKEKIGGSPMG